MKIRKAEIADADGIARVHVESWQTTYKGIMPDEYLAGITIEKRRRLWANILSSETNDIFEKSVIFVVENETGEIVGFVSGGKKKTPDNEYEGELGGIYLLKEYQRQGIGQQLVEIFVQSLLDEGVGSMSLSVLADNSSKFFYEKLGGEKVSETKTVIGGKELKHLIYGWKHIRKILKP